MVPGLDCVRVHFCSLGGCVSPSGLEVKALRCPDEMPGIAARGAPGEPETAQQLALPSPDTPALLCPRVMLPGHEQKMNRSEDLINSFCFIFK